MTLQEYRDTAPTMSGYAGTPPTGWSPGTNSVVGYRTCELCHGLTKVHPAIAQRYREEREQFFREHPNAHSRLFDGW